ncbi:Putative peptidoglycan binding domain-containing protein [Roseivivax lentus]|uniref:Putative peptidoglycan binding domain-containing protein n=1 Tax=Roseivivax lentus TaxID=633194 RepID=A0A1N7LZP1_9RHOB|nr:serine protease [Roseivivax lentus]SIS79171.1 Putative peptidoglycan binding domain-containing protein [Roseivivax lentus]
MTRSVLMAGSALWLLAGAAAAQEAHYIQIEAHPALAVAESRARDFAAQLPDVNGFSLGAGWYGIALGPYDEAEANRLRLALRSAGRIPPDSYVEEAEEYARRFFPVGADAVQSPAPAAEEGPQGTEEVRAAPVVTPAPQPDPDETVAEARRSEAQLTRAQRAELQVALRWAGFYQGGIDAAFGRGTRGAMAGWQEGNGFEVTGILTTRQRAELLRQYNAVLDGLEMTRVVDRRAGIEMAMPLGAVAYARSEAPFVHYDASGDLPARVLLISQPGDRQTLAGLYEIMQTLEIVPLGGPRERSRDRFTLTGANSRIVSHTEARLVDGAVKGFTLIWPAGDEERRSRVLALMQESFTPLAGVVLDPGTLSGDAQAIDLVAGLQVRQPKNVASGFFVDARGRVLTSAQAVAECGRITLDETTEAQIVAQADGVALLAPDTPLAPREVAVFRADVPRLQSEVAVSGFSYGGVLGAPTLSFGRLADLKGLNGEPGMARLEVAANPGDAGGPVFDGGGAVVGMLVPAVAEGRQLPDGVSFATASERLIALSSGAGVEIATGQGDAFMAPEDLTQVARAMTVLVSCWE